MTRTELGRRELWALVAVSYSWFALLLIVFDSYPTRVIHAGDNWSYSQESSIIRGAPASGLYARHFLGYPMTSAPIAALLHISDMNALPIAAVISSLAAIFLACELWGAWAAAWFAVINLDWVQRSLLGGAEPLFAALIFASLLAVRHERWITAALLGALATIVRPLGVFALVAMGIILLFRRRLRLLVLAVGISLVVGIAYIAFLSALYGHSTDHLSWYRSMGLGRDRTFIPFVTIFQSFRNHEITGKNVAKTLVWLTFTLAAIVLAYRPGLRATVRENPVEWLFGAIYVASFLLFPGWWIEGEYPRYLVPVIPMLFIALRPWLPLDRRFIWAIGLLSVTLAAVEDMPFFGRALKALLP